MIKDRKKEEIALQVIKTLKSRFDNFPANELINTNTPFHEAFLKAFANQLKGKVVSIPVFISLSSWAHGLKTTLGQSFFEEVAHILSDGVKKGFTSNLGTSLKITETQQINISDIVTRLKNAQDKPYAENENRIVFKIDGSPVKDSTDFTVDNFVEDETSIEAIELKTVRPNSGVAKEEKSKFLTAKAALKYKYQNKNIEYFIAFPFDPFSDTPTGFNKMNFISKVVDLKKYFHPDEILLAGELWDRLSGYSGTMVIILSIINDIATPEFMEKLSFISDIKNLRIDKDKFLKFMREWHLYSELNLYSKFDVLFEKCEKNKKYQRILYQPIFKVDGIYNSGRFFKLREILEQD